MTEEERNLAAVHHVVHDYANLVSSGSMAVNGHHLRKAFDPPVNTHIGHAFLVNCRKMYEAFLYRRPRIRYTMTSERPISYRKR